MFEKKDYLNYFDQMLKIEEDAEKNTEWLSEKIKNQEARFLLSKIIIEKQKYIIITKDLIRLLGS